MNGGNRLRTCGARSSWWTQRPSRRTLRDSPIECDGRGSPRVPDACATKSVSVTIAGLDLTRINIPALKKSHAASAKTMSERVYPLVYIFENSVRDLIELEERTI